MKSESCRKASPTSDCPWDRAGVLPKDSCRKTHDVGCRRLAANRRPSMMSRVDFSLAWCRRISIPRLAGDSKQSAWRGRYLARAVELCYSVPQQPFLTGSQNRPFLEAFYQLWIRLTFFFFIELLYVQAVHGGVCLVGRRLCPTCDCVN